ncbi:unnamed protein product [Ascophyllum nodosum]
MGAESDKDFLNSDFPMYTAALVGIFLLYRVYVSNMRGEPLQPTWLAEGVFPAAFFTFIGALACHEMYLDMTGYPGGLSAWAPSIVTFLAATFVAYRGKTAASGGDLGVASIGLVVACAFGALHLLLQEHEVEEPPENFTKAQAREAAREAAKASKRLSKMVGMGGQPAPAPAPVPATSPMLFLEKGSDFISEQMHVALAVAVFAILVAGLVNGPGEWPRNLQKGSFPACFMMLTGVMAWNAFVREARSFEDGSLDDFAPAFIGMLSAMVVANIGASMQTQSVPRLS